MRFRFLLLICLLGAALRVHAADSRPMVGPGATKDEVIDTYGWPTGQSKAGAKEVLSYPQGQVTLDNGRVERVDFSMNVPWPAPRPRPGPPSATSAKKGDPAVDFWLTNFDDAVREARRRRARILALFTGPDWSPGSKQFHDEVEYHADFVNAFTGDFVFLRLEFATRSPQSVELREQNNRLRERYSVTTYPALIVLAPDGRAVAAVDLAKPQPGDSYRARTIAAVREVRDLLALRPPEPPPAEPAGPAPEPEKAGPSTGTAAIASSLTSARWLVSSAFVWGGAITLLLFWLVWRNWAARSAPAPKASMAARISDAASGIPTEPELVSWPRQKVCTLVAALAESDGYLAEVQPAGSDKDVVLRRGGEPKPRVVVGCMAGSSGPLPAKRLRHLFATMTADGVDTGWFVSPAGFAHDARSYAEQHQILLIDSDHLIAQLRDLPPLLLPKVLGRVA